MEQSMVARAMVFLDYQNVHFGALEAFDKKGTHRAVGHVDPLRVAQAIVASRKEASSLVGVRVYRGRPLPDYQPKVAEANDRQANRWDRDPLVAVVRRPLRYPRQWPQSPALEKGIDVALAVDFVRLAIEGAYDVGILFSGDTDLMPALETVAGLNSAAIEVAAWKRGNRLRFPGSDLPWCHILERATYQHCRDHRNYTLPWPIESGTPPGPEAGGEQ